MIRQMTPNYKFRAEKDNEIPLKGDCSPYSPITEKNNSNSDFLKGVRGNESDP